MCEAALATYLTLLAPLLWQPVQKRDRFSRTTNFTRSHTPQHAGSPPCCFECLRMRVEWTDVRPIHIERFPVQTTKLARSRSPTRRMFNIDGEREQANWDMAAILELQSLPLVSFRKKTGRPASYCKKREHVKLR